MGAQTCGLTDNKISAKMARFYHHVACGKIRRNTDKEGAAGLK
jgi:hypothetical protein